MDIAIDASAIAIETPRLILPPFAGTDLADSYAYASQPGVGEAAGWPHHERVETTEAIFQTLIERKEVFAVVHKEDGKVIGSLGVHKSGMNADERYQHPKIREIGCVLFKERWTKQVTPL